MDPIEGGGMMRPGKYYDCNHQVVEYQTHCWSSPFKKKSGMLQLLGLQCFNILIIETPKYIVIFQIISTSENFFFTPIIRKFK